MKNPKASKKNIEIEAIDIENARRKDMSVANLVKKYENGLELKTSGEKSHKNPPTNGAEVQHPSQRLLLSV